MSRICLQALATRFFPHLLVPAKHGSHCEKHSVAKCMGVVLDFTARRGKFLLVHQPCLLFIFFPSPMQAMHVP